MRENKVKRLWNEGKPALGGWLMMPDPSTAEIMANAGYDWLCIDTQHGLIGYQVALQMLQAISTTPTVPIVRVRWNDPGEIMKALDAGAYGVIVPLINTRADVEKAVAACRYPPAGIRSYGPTRTLFYGGPDYFDHANEEVLCIPMIETRPALDNLEEILSVPGVDAVYIGPMDLSLALGLAPRADRDGDAVYTEARQRVLDGCHRHRVVAGIHAGPAAAAGRVADGFKLVLVSSDGDILARGARRDLESVRGAS